MSQDKNKEYLHRQLVRLGDMMGDGCHLEPDGAWIGKEYNKILKTLGLIPRKKRNSTFIDKAMKTRLQQVTCKECNGILVQTRKGSMRGKCVDCGAKFQLLKRK